MEAGELVRSGQLSEAIKTLVTDLREHPADHRRRTFLFELLCFAGQYDRAEKHLNILAQNSRDAELGGLLYRSALSAERKRQALFDSAQLPESPLTGGRTLSGTLNGKRFTAIEDLDPRIGPRLEIFVAGEYLWLPFEHIGRVRMSAPKFLRDTLWASAVIETGPSFKGQDFGEVLIPVLAPSSWLHESDEVKLGRITEWKEEGQVLIPFGQKLLLVDDEEAIPFLQIRELDFDAPEAGDTPDPPPLE